MVKFRRATTEAEADGPFRYHKRKDVLSIDLQVLLLLVLGQFYDTAKLTNCFTSYLTLMKSGHQIE